MAQATSPSQPVAASISEWSFITPSQWRQPPKKALADARTHTPFTLSLTCGCEHQRVEFHRPKPMAAASLKALADARPHTPFTLPLACGCEHQQVEFHRPKPMAAAPKKHSLMLDPTLLLPFLSHVAASVSE